MKQNVIVYLTFFTIVLGVGILFLFFHVRKDAFQQGYENGRVAQRAIPCNYSMIQMSHMSCTNCWVDSTLDTIRWQLDRGGLFVFRLNGQLIKITADTCNLNLNQK